MKKFIGSMIAVMGIAVVVFAVSGMAIQKLNKTGIAERKNEKQIANPYQTCNTMEEAEKIAGFLMTAPKGIQGFELPIIQVIANERIQVTYKQGNTMIIIRKAKGLDDISGDCSQYEKERTVGIEGRCVLLKGNGDRVNVAIWKKDTYSYAITVNGLGLAESQIGILVKMVD